MTRASTAGGDERRATGQPNHPVSDQLLERYLPAPFLVRLPAGDAWWRGRAILLLWALGYPLEMAWSVGLTADDELSTELRGWMSHLDDERLVADLDATADLRGDGSHLAFVTFGRVPGRPPVP